MGLEWDSSGTRVGLEWVEEGLTKPASSCITNSAVVRKSGERRGLLKSVWAGSEEKEPHIALPPRQARASKLFFTLSRSTEFPVTKTIRGHGRLSAKASFQTFHIRRTNSVVLPIRVIRVITYVGL